MNKLLPSILIALFAIVLVLDCVFIINGADDMRIYTKPLLMPILYILLTVKTVDTKHKRSKLYISLAILFSFLGDFALLNDDGNFYFLAGIGCFLVVHIWYVLFFIRIKPFSVKRIPSLVLLGIVILIYIYLLLSYIWPNVSDEVFLVPLVGYSLVIGTMLLAAFNTGTGHRIRKTALPYFIPGGILFVASDSLLAVSKFGPIAKTADKAMQSTHVIMYGATIMLAYGVAQLLLVSGAAKVIRK